MIHDTFSILVISRENANLYDEELNIFTMQSIEGCNKLVYVLTKAVVARLQVKIKK